MRKRETTDDVFRRKNSKGAKWGPRKKVLATTDSPSSIITSKLKKLFHEVIPSDFIQMSQSAQAEYIEVIKNMREASYMNTRLIFCSLYVINQENIRPTNWLTSNSPSEPPKAYDVHIFNTYNMSKYLSLKDSGIKPKIKTEEERSMINTLYYANIYRYITMIMYSMNRFRGIKEEYPFFEEEWMLGFDENQDLDDSEESEDSDDSTDNLN